MFFDEFLDWQKVGPKFKNQIFGRQFEKMVVGLVGVGGRGGLPGKIKSWGLEDCLYLLSGSARRTQGVGGFKGYNSLCRRPL